MKNNNNKQPFELPEIEIIEFDEENIITDSSNHYHYGESNSDEWSMNS